MNKYVSVILLTHKSEKLVYNFIKPLYNKFKIIIVDNSNDKNLENKINNEFPNINFKIIENNGYGSAINFGSN